AALAQAVVPQTFNYQAVARDAAGKPLANKTIKVRLSFMSGAEVDYSETRSVTTNPLGLFALVVGDGKAQSIYGDVKAINYESPVTLRVEMDAANGTNFTIMGEQVLSSVPFAIHAKHAASADAIEGTPPAFHYVNNNSLVLQSNGPDAVILFSGKQLDTRNAYNPQTGIYTIPEDGIYSFYANATAGPNNSIGNIFSLVIRVTGSVNSGNGVGSSLAHQSAFSVNYVRALKKGDKVFVVAHNYNGNGSVVVTYGLGGSTAFGGFKIR
ncbi:MAG TPA: hypothetical protein VHK69_05280, partial [Chitinophagaceae bacterium]|nr:hypothetical protein [Chitinophagaceae bacterium]